MVGVNGGGKTTSAAKLAAPLQARRPAGRARGRRHLPGRGPGAARALGPAARRPGRHRARYGADPASVAFDAAQIVKAGKADVLVVDTAGRVHTNANLMSELEKVGRIIGRELPGARVESLLVLDADGRPERRRPGPRVPEVLRPDRASS
ncbi:MAG: hypothetical protein MZV64_49650 [Ignavibacteriales bacterium]|nr:hypothetical protein [Ignavibacteriales bacterium]